MDPLDLQVELTTSDGVTVALPLSRWGAIPPPLAVRLVKDELVASLSVMDVGLGAPVELVLQSYEIPFAEYAASDPTFDPRHVTGLRLMIDRTIGGCLWITEVGLLVPS